jgi:methionyl-tRNA formyltransferase
MRVLFCGYSQLGYRALRLLDEMGWEVAAVVTHRDDPAEERWYRTPAEAAQELGLPLHYSEDVAAAARAGGEGIGGLAERLAPDLVLSVFYRDMLPGRVLAAARQAALNLHPSLLPAYRGRAPINWVLVNGESQTGVTLHHMIGRADAGDIVGQRAVAIAPRETALSLYRKVEDAGVELLAALLPRLADGTAPRLQQDDSRATTFGRRRPEDGRIDWSWPAARIDCLVRAVAPPWPGAFGEIEGRRVEIFEGEPGERIATDGAGGRPAPGTVRREALDGRPGGRVWVATGDRWFEVRQAAGLGGLALPGEPGAGASSGTSSGASTGTGASDGASSGAGASTGASKGREQ